MGWLKGEQYEQKKPDQSSLAKDSRKSVDDASERKTLTLSMIQKKEQRIQATQQMQRRLGHTLSPNMSISTTIQPPTNQISTNDLPIPSVQALNAINNLQIQSIQPMNTMNNLQIQSVQPMNAVNNLQIPSIQAMNIMNNLQVPSVQAMNAINNLKMPLIYNT